MIPYYREVGDEVEVFDLCYKNRLPLMIKGPTGCGKSQFVAAMAARHGRPIIKVACNEDTTASDLLGRFFIKNMETAWQDGPVVRAVREGAILYLDEVAEAREDVIVVLHSITDHRRELYIDRINESLSAPESFMCVTSFNPGYKSGFKEMKPSTRQRFVTLALGYPPPEIEIEILIKMTGVAPAVAKAMVALADGIRKQPQLGLRETISTRLLIYSAGLINGGMHPRKALLHGAIESLTDDAKIIQALKDTAALHFLKSEVTVDLVEWMFGKFVKQRQNVRKTLEESSVAYAEDEIASLQILMGFVLTDEPLPIAFGAGIGRAGRTTLHLPESIGLSSDQELNRELYLHKILSASMIHRERFAYSAVGLSYAERTLEILAASDRVVARLNEQFPKFGEFHRSLTARLSNIRKAPISKESAEDREAEALLNGGHAGKYFRWQRFPERTLAPWVELMSPSDLSADRISVSVENQKDPKVLKEKKAPETELLGKSSTESPEEVSLEKKKKEQSPVFHSFEKLETADEYGGGSRVTDADDDLGDHFDALEELNLRHVTREGGEAGSIYKAQFSELMGFHLGRAGTPRYPHYKFTDEWDYKRKGFLPEHCRLYLLDANAHQRENSVVDFKQNLKKIYSAELEVWRHKITALVNQRAWRDRQVDGEEWNIDATTRYLADMKSCGFGDNRLFSRRVRRHRDFRVTILMDLSLSSDSWVMNKRVLDIQLDSVGLCGLLLEQMSEPISVLGTWSETRHHCYLDTIKKFDSSWDEFFKIGSEIAPRGYTRLGPAIRHAVSEFQSVKSKNRLLILLTDGKPTDLDHYEGHYGIEDMRHAMMEAEQAGVHVHALAVDQEAKSYFPQLFNPNRYQILSDPRKLPEQLFKIYFGFTRGK